MRALLIFPVILVSSGVLASGNSPTVDRVLNANRAAMGRMPGAGTLRLSYTYRSSGLNGSFDTSVDLGTGAFVNRYDLSAISGANGFDNQVPWQTDVSGVSTAQEGGDRVPVAVSEAYRNANLWWRKDRAGASISYRSRQTINGHLADRLLVKPRGGKSFDAWFDTRTHFLVQVVETQQFFKVVTAYGNYRPESGMMLPHSQTIDTGAGSADQLVMQRAARGPALGASAFSRPRGPASGGHIEGDAKSVTLPFRLLNNHVYVEAMVDGHGPYTFIVDTGGHTLLSPRLAAEVGLKVTGEGVSTGAGSGSTKTGFARYREIALGPVKLTGQPAFISSIYDKSIEGIDVDGMLGFELFSRFAVTLDYGAKTMRICNFGAFDPKGLGAPVPFKFYDHLPSVTGLIDTLPARLDIDTGSRSEVSVTSAFVAREKLRERYRPGIDVTTGWGAGGASRSYVVRLPSLTLGTVKADNIVAGLSEDKGGSLSDPNFEGNIGSGLLKRFVVSFDYSHQTMFLKRLDPQPADAGRFDRSGLWINATSDGYKVTEVATGSPGEAAGIRAGDIIESINGQRVHAEKLSDARMLLRSLSPGSHVTLVLKRDGQLRSVDLVLRDLI